MKKLLIFSVLAFVLLYFSSLAKASTIVLNVGSGTGNLVIDGSSYTKNNHYIIKVKAGIYTGITIQNINLNEQAIIQNKGLVQLAGNSASMNLSNVSNLTVTGTGAPGITQGFYFHDNNYRPVSVNGLTHNLTLQNFKFSNTGDYTISFSTGNTVYDGSDKTCFYNVKLANITCSGTGQFLQMGGGFNNGVITGLVKNLEISGLNFSNSDCGVAIYVGDAEAYNIHNNIINNINKKNNNHNGIFLMIGNGSFHDNLIENHQGNAIRAWGVSIGTKPQNVLIYNNVVHDSRKYSAFEVQSFANMIFPGKSTFVNVSVYNNVCGNLNLIKDWYGVIVDVYDLLGGYCKVYNNKAFNFPSPNPHNNIVSQQATTVPILSNNSYFPTAAKAGISDVNKMAIKR